MKVSRKNSWSRNHFLTSPDSGPDTHVHVNPPHRGLGLQGLVGLTVSQEIQLLQFSLVGALHLLNHPWG